MLCVFVLPVLLSLALLWWWQWGGQSPPPERASATGRTLDLLNDERWVARQRRLLGTASVRRVWDVQPPMSQRYADGSGAMRVELDGGVRAYFKPCDVYVVLSNGERSPGAEWWTAEVVAHHVDRALGGLLNRTRPAVARSLSHGALLDAASEPADRARLAQIFASPHCANDGHARLSGAMLQWIDEPVRVMSLETDLWRRYAPSTRGLDLFFRPCDGGGEGPVDRAPPGVASSVAVEQQWGMLLLFHYLIGSVKSANNFFLLKSQLPVGGNDPLPVLLLDNDRSQYTRREPLAERLAWFDGAQGIPDQLPHRWCWRLRWHRQFPELRQLVHAVLPGLAARVTRSLHADQFDQWNQSQAETLDWRAQQCIALLTKQLE